MQLSEKDCLELLPWFLNGTLNETEQQAVSEQLAHSSSLQEELAQLRFLKQHLPPEPEIFPASTLGWKRLQKNILAEQDQPQAEVAPSAQQTEQSRNWFKPLAIAAMLVITVQVGLLTQKSTEQSASSMQLLSGTPVHVADHQYLLQIEIAPEASWQQLQSLLRNLNADLVQGPSAIGLVHIRLSLDQLELDGQAPQSAEAVVSWLQSQSIIEHVALEP